MASKQQTDMSSFYSYGDMVLLVIYCSYKQMILTVFYTYYFFFRLHLLRILVFLFLKSMFWISDLQKQTNTQVY